MRRSLPSLSFHLSTLLLLCAFHRAFHPCLAIPVSFGAVLRSCRASLVGGGLLAASWCLPSPACGETIRWELINGNVALDDPFDIAVPKGKYSLKSPKLVGAGGGGAVFRFDSSSILLKVSWERSARSVEKECRTMQLLEEKHVTASERCLGQNPYKSDQKRVAILVEPYVPDAVASVVEVKPEMQSHAVEQIARNLIQMLASNVVTIDVQPLMSKTTGQVTFIDLTEAEVLHPPLNFMAKALVSSYITEMMTLIPDEFMQVASHAALDELNLLREQGVTLPLEIMDVLEATSELFISTDSK